MWDTIIYNYLKKRNIVIPPKERSDKDSKYAGAYVKEPIPGKYDWVVSFDLNSLYPQLIMQYNISPETLLEERHPSATVDKILNEELTFELYKDNAVCANGAMYRKDVRGFLPELMEKISVLSSLIESVNNVSIGTNTDLPMPDDNMDDLENGSLESAIRLRNNPVVKGSVEQGVQYCEEDLLVPDNLPVSRLISVKHTYIF